MEAVLGDPDLSQTETTYVERFNGTLRQWCKRYTRKTYAFSKKWSMLRAPLALNIAHYNFCRVHGTLQVTPAMQAGIVASKGKGKGSHGQLFVGIKMTTVKQTEIGEGLLNSMLKDLGIRKEDFWHEVRVSVPNYTVQRRRVRRVVPGREGGEH